MPELIEIVFEKLNQKSVIWILQNYIKSEVNLKNYNFFSSSEELFEKNDFLILEKKLLDLVNFYCITNIKMIKTKYFIIKNTSIITQKNGEEYDLTIAFESDDITPHHLSITDSLFEFSKELAKLFGTDIYYAGIDPAQDPNTRFFTKNIRGPIYYFSS